MSAEVSHGRGGAGNITPDVNQYADGEIVRAGVEGSHGDGAYSSGRGGAGNIADINKPSTPRNDHDVIPPTAAVRQSAENKEYHTGRGGAGNEHTATAPNATTDGAKHKEKKAADTPVSLADKLKNKLFKFGKK